MKFSAATTVLDDALARGAFPAAVAEVGRRDGALWTAAVGRLWGEAAAPPATVSTVFDLASLTKVMATTALALDNLRTGTWRLETHLADVLPGWIDPHGPIQLRHLLDHSSGLAAHARFWEQGLRGHDAYLSAIAALPAPHPPGRAGVYSDLGFILLAFALEAQAGMPLADLFSRLADRLQIVDLAFRPPPSWIERTAPTEVDPWRGHLLRGEVHDENAWALDGVAGHAGLFGTAAAVGQFARAVLTAFSHPATLGDPELMRLMARPTGVPGSSRALGWDTMLPTSSCGTRMSPTAIGHTGFTGTSLWIDWERDAYAVLLTNRVCPTRANNLISQVRPAFHDAVWDELGR